MEVPIILNFEETKVIGKVILDDNVKIDWLKMGFTETVLHADGKGILKSVSVILRKLRSNL